MLKFASLYLQYRLSLMKLGITLECCTTLDEALETREPRRMEMLALVWEATWTTDRGLTNGHNAVLTILHPITTEKQVTEKIGVYHSVSCHENI